MYLLYLVVYFFCTILCIFRETRTMLCLPFLCWRRRNKHEKEQKVSYRETFVFVKLPLFLLSYFIKYLFLFE